MEDFSVVVKLILLVICRVVGVQEGGDEEAAPGGIAGGRPVANITQYPYMVSIQTCSAVLTSGGCSNDSQQTHRCGGGLLNPYLVITACHCLADIPENGTAKPTERGVDSFSFVAGTTNLVKTSPKAQVRSAERIYYHPKCASIKGAIIYDLALARLKKPFKFNVTVKRLNFFSSDADIENKIKEITSHQKSQLNTNSSSPSPKDMPRCVVAGWGDTNHGSHNVTTSSDTMNAAFVDIIPEEQCSAAFSKARVKVYENFTFHQHHQICGVSSFGNASTCGGDSGSPLVCDGFLIALVSYGCQRASPLPSVYQTYITLNTWISLLEDTHHPREGEPISSAAGDTYFGELSTRSITLHLFLQPYTLSYVIFCWMRI